MILPRSRSSPRAAIHEAELGPSEPQTESSTLLPMTVSMVENPTQDGYTAIAGLTTYRNSQGAWYASLPASHVFYIGAAITALMVGGVILALNQPGFSSVRFQASQMDGVHRLLESVIVQKLPDGLRGNVFLQPDHVANTREGNPGIDALWVSANTDGTFSLNKEIVGADGEMVGSGPQRYVPAFDIATDGTIRPHAMTIQLTSSYDSLAGGQASPAQRLAASRTTAAEVHDVSSTH